MFLALLILILPAPCDGQLWTAGGALSANLMVGNSSDLLDSGRGLDLHLARRLGSGLSLRVDGSFIGLDDQTTLDEVAGNSMVILWLDPELAADWSRLGFYVRGMIGRVANVQVRSNSALAERTTWANALGVGLGLRFSLGARGGLDLEAELVKLRGLDFARTAGSSSALLQDPTLLRGRAGV